MMSRLLVAGPWLWVFIEACYVELESTYVPREGISSHSDVQGGNAQGERREDSTLKCSATW